MADIASFIEPVLGLWNERRAQEGSADAVYATLREAILSRSLRPGYPFAEEDLAQIFEVSRTPIREAILRLESEHLIERRGRRRLSVSEISPDEVLEIYDVRVVLDALAAELAAQHATPPEIAQLRWANDQLREAGAEGDLVRMSGLNLEFHDWMAQAGRNSFLLDQLRAVRDRVRRFERTTFAYPGRWETVIAEHDEILAGIEAHDPKRATRAARSHMLNSKKVRLVMVEEDHQQHPDAGHAG
jgi:DNA-binding GntR family transcriptional regulator